MARTVDRGATEGRGDTTSSQANWGHTDFKSVRDPEGKESARAHSLETMLDSLETMLDLCAKKERKPFFRLTSAFLMSILT